MADRQIGFRVDPDLERPEELDPLLSGMFSALIYVVCLNSNREGLRSLEQVLVPSLEELKPLAETDDFRRGQVYTIRGLLHCIRRIRDQADSHDRV